MSTVSIKSPADCRPWADSAPPSNDIRARSIQSIGIVRVEEVTSSTSALWDRYVEAHTEASLFHGLAWKRAVEATFGHQARYFVATSEDQDGPRIVGVLPCFEIDSLVACRIMVSVPYATYGGVLCDDDASCATLLARAKEFVVSRGARMLELRSIRACDAELDVAEAHSMFRRELPANGDVMGWLPRKARAAARTAASRYELAVEFGGEIVDEVWNLYSRSMRRLGSPNYPRRFFRELLRHLGTDCVLQLVRFNGRPAAGLMTFLHRDMVMPYFSGIDERLDLYGLSHFLYVESMRWGVEHGYRVYDFGRTRKDNRGPYEFKRHCGFEPEALEYQVFVSPGQRAPNISPTASRYSAARKLWKRLPLSVTRPLGAWMSRSLPG